MKGLLEGRWAHTMAHAQEASQNCSKELVAPQSLEVSSDGST